MNLILLLLLSVALFTLPGCRETVSGVPEAPPPRPAAADLPLGIIGETEAVYLDGFQAPFEARIDTGATTSSIDAREIRTFERNGRKWVRFQVVNRASQEKRSYELPVVRTVQIKRHEAESAPRLSVMLTFRIGHLTLEREFTLADREKFKYPALLGRNVISGLAAVDPSRHNTL